MLTNKLLEQIKLADFEIVQIDDDDITIRKEYSEEDYIEIIFNDSTFHFEERDYGIAHNFSCHLDDLKTFVGFMEEYKIFSRQRKENQIKKIKDEIDFIEKKGGEK